MQLTQTVINRAVRNFMSRERLNQTELGNLIGIPQRSVSSRLNNSARWNSDDIDALVAAEILAPIVDPLDIYEVSDNE